MCIVGAGTAGLEGLLAARELLGERVGLHLVCPEAEFRYRPMSPGSPFRPAAERALEIGALVEQSGASWTPDRAALVDESERMLVTHDGESIRFDGLLIAAGRRYERVLEQGHAWVRGSDPAFLDAIIAALAAGEKRSVCVAAPDGVRWQVPAYELALVLAWSSAPGAHIALVTAEPAPLAALGASASAAVARELAAAGVELRAAVRSEEQLAEATAGFEELISLPAAHGPSIAGVASDALGFVETDSALQACGSSRVWAAGGCVAAALEHSALSARQADAAADAIAARLTGAASTGPTPPVHAPELAGVILEGQRDAWLAANPPGTVQPSTRCLWWPPGRAVGARLASHIAALHPDVMPSLPQGQPPGLYVSAPVALGCREQDAPPSHEPTAADRVARLRDIETRQQMALRRRERRAEEDLLDMQRRLRDLQEREQRVARELQRDGYLHERPGGRVNPGS